MPLVNRHGHKGVSTTETVVGIAVLGILAVIVAWVGYQQSRYDPKLFQNQVGQASRPAPVESILVEGETVFASMPALSEGGSAPGATAKAGTAMDLAVLVPPDLKPMGPPEQFGHDTLSDKIDGKAELYFECGFVSMVCQRFVHAEMSNLWFELFVYDMGNPLNAFSIYSIQRRPGVRDSDVAQFAYTTDNALFFVQGKHYVEIVAAEPDDMLRQGIEAAGRRFVEKNKADATELSGMAYLPADGLIKSTVKLLLKDAYGYDGLTDVVSAGYNVDGTTTTAFVSARKDAAEASVLAEGYYKMITNDMGGEVVEPTSGTVAGMKLARILGDYEAVFVSGNILAGVHTAKRRELAEKLAARLDAAIREKMK